MGIDILEAIKMISLKGKANIFGLIVHFTWANFIKASGKDREDGNQALRIMSFTLVSLSETKSKDRENTFGTIDLFTRVTFLTI